MSAGPSKKRAGEDVHPFFMKKARQSSLRWHKPFGGTCLYATNLAPALSSKIAAFDLDGTLIKPSLGRGAVKKAPKGAPPAWDWWTPNKVPETLQNLTQDGYSIVVISNQAIRSASLPAWKEKIGLVADALPSVPFRLFAATAKDGYRKPMPGMWNQLSTMFKEQGVEIDKSASFYVGDAAGRKADFAATDRMWALNVGLPFFTPEEYFLNQTTNTNYEIGFDVTTLLDLPRFSPDDKSIIPDPKQLEVVLFVGYPGVGKSTVCRQYFTSAGYQRINQDTLGSRDKCMKAVASALTTGTNNTNRDLQTRKFYIEIARKFDVPIRCFLFTGSRELAWHNNLYRALNLPPTVASREEKHALVPEVAFNSFTQNYEEPNVSEGFSEIRKVNFVFEGTEEEKRYWSMWLHI
ncbi:hypothetical protein D9757_001630 [Collybiopsis confluens]|uniref:Uncharacterized protein n=1 Tax=Collybiopsis confluens TaxID=2823264 RepID=A0A8H5HYP1_9AGAR|nr:hypothetical protein D9757_001630 [Collybiopsis confluens]